MLLAEIAKARPLSFFYIAEQNVYFILCLISQPHSQKKFLFCFYLYLHIYIYIYIYAHTHIHMPFPQPPATGPILIHMNTVDILRLDPD